MRGNPVRAQPVRIIAMCAAAAIFMPALTIRALAAAPSCPQSPVVVAQLLLPPPARDSAETRAEMDELLRLQNARTPDQARHAAGDHERTIERFLGEIGIKVGPLPASAKHFFDCLAGLAEHKVTEAKAVFMRPRPYQMPHAHLRVLKRIGDDDETSYPSGHAAYGTIVGLVLAEMLPERRQDIYRRIRDFGFSRLVSGVHFRSDVYAGEVAGAAIAASLFESEAFRSEFAQVKIELRKAVDASQ